MYHGLYRYGLAFPKRYLHPMHTPGAFSDVLQLKYASWASWRKRTYKWRKEI